VAGLERFPVDGVGDQGLRGKLGQGQRFAVAVGGLPDQPLGLGLDPCSVQEGLEGNPGPPGTADEVTADWVGDAGQGVGEVARRQGLELFQA